MGSELGASDTGRLTRDAHVPGCETDRMTGEDGALPGSSRALLDAVIAMSTDLDLSRVLDRIVVSACELTGAQYGALGVIGEDGGLAEFVHHGIDDATRERIGTLPEGRGILGLLIDEPVPIRLPRLQDHPASYGFPPDHPPMTTFLGVPVRVRGTVFGNLYLTDKAEGSAFTEQDQELVEALASAAGFVIENAHAYARSERQRVWLEAAANLYDTLQPPLTPEQALGHVATGTRAACGARTVGVLVADDGAFEVAGADGRDADALPQLCERVSDELTAATEGDAPPPVHVPGAGVALLAPLRTHLYKRVVIVALMEDMATARKERELLLSFADQAALAVDRIQAIADREELAVVSDRDRIARDLHDVVIQRLFATGLMLQGTRAKAVVPEVKVRLDQAVDDLDTTIRDIRTTIFQLRNQGGGGLREAVLDLAGQYAPTLGFTPVVRTSGPIDTAVPAERADDVLAVLREALSNTARHAQASSVHIEVAVADQADGRWLLLRIADNGVGLPDRRDESGLGNVRRRAVEHHGSVRIGRRQPAGTLVEWKIPLVARG